MAAEVRQRIEDAARGASYDIGALSWWGEWEASTADDWLNERGTERSTATRQMANPVAYVDREGAGSDRQLRECFVLLDSSVRKHHAQTYYFMPCSAG
jgi:hypothetical protein